MEVTCSLLSRSRRFSREGNDGKTQTSTGAMHVTTNKFLGIVSLRETIFFLTVRLSGETMRVTQKDRHLATVYVRI